MLCVQFYKLQDDGAQKIVATCELRGDAAICEGDPALIFSLEHDGIYDSAKSDREKLFPKDGMRFLEQLRFNFKSGYLNASEVKQAE